MFESRVERQPYWRRFRFSLIVLVIILVTLLVLRWVRDRAAASDVVIDPNILDVGRVVGIILVALLFLRAVVNLGRWFARRDEHIRIYDQGFAWTRSGVTHKYSWNKLRTLRERGHGIYLR
ncbi:MAG: hypothetical protein K8L99_35770, partial [Anaerolineae bacterium]|nr:hypothetical protein [Anaerolineae bacterium]